MASIYFYFITLFTILLTLNNISSYVSCIVSLFGSAIIICALSWKVSKRVHSHYSRRNPISSFQKAVLITGCDTGFGNRLALKLNERGFVVYATVIDTESDGSKQLQENCVFPKSMNVIKMDVTNDEEVTKTYNYVSEHLKRERIELWGLVNNAGIMIAAHIEWSTIDLLRKTFEVNVFGAVRVTRTFLPLIRESRGRIVNLSSIMSRITRPLLSHYCMSKYAVLSFTDALRRELQRLHIKVCAILPGGFATNLLNSNNLSQAYDNAWNTTNEDVKQAHGYDYYKSEKHEFFADCARYQKCTNIELVVDAIIDALTNQCPQIRYTVIEDWMTEILMFLNDVLPEQCIDRLLLFNSYLNRNELFTYLRQKFLE